MGTVKVISEQRQLGYQRELIAPIFRKATGRRMDLAAEMWYMGLSNPARTKWGMAIVS
jgi:hypothetical protein